MIQASATSLFETAPDQGVLPPLEVCHRARESRDARFDGLFYTAVRSTRVYCRSICPAPTCKRTSVIYYPTAASAQAAGYRPCLRCRPELAPGPNVDDDADLRRALALIGSGFLADASVDALARELGMSSRHLRRRFMERLGAAPLAVHSTQRLLQAKRFLTDTSWPIAQVAAAAGFASVRRFNAAFAQDFRMCPSVMRRRATPDADLPVSLRLHYRPPYDHAATLAHLAATATPGLEKVEGGVWWRALGSHRASRWLSVSPVPGHTELRLDAYGVASDECPTLVRRVRRMFDLDADFAAVQRALSTDADLAQRLARRPGLRLPGVWDGFELCVALLLQGNAPSAATSSVADAPEGPTLARLIGAYGQVHAHAPEGLGFVFPTPARLATALLEEQGIHPAAAQHVRALAVAARDGALDFAAAQARDGFVAKLQALLRWPRECAEWVALRVLGDPDACPWPDEHEDQAARWRPWRAYSWIYGQAGPAQPQPETRERALVDWVPARSS